MTDNAEGRADMLELTANIVAAYAAKNALPAGELPQLIETVYASLDRAGAPAPAPEQKPAVPVKRSITDEALICLECGRKQKTLKRHLATAHGLTPDDYRAKWQLRTDYPMVAPAYGEKRRRLAKEIGLGRKPGKRAAKRRGKS